MSRLPRANAQMRLVVATVAAIALANLLAMLAYTPNHRAHDLGERIAHSRLDPVIAGGLWAAALAALLVIIAFGVLRKRRGAWYLALGLLAVIAVLQVIHEGSPAQVALPIAGVGSLIAMRRYLVAEPYRELLRRHMLPTPDALERTADLLAKYGRDTMAPFKMRTDVGHLFSREGDAVLAFRVENRCLLVAGDPVGTPEGIRDVVSHARDLARGAGLRFGVSTASEEFANILTSEFGMKALYMGCEAVVATAPFSLQGHKIKKVRQAHRRVQREGYTLECTPASDICENDRAALQRLEDLSREADGEQSFVMAPESIAAPGLANAQLVLARHAESGQIAGVMAFVPLAKRSMWSLAVQLRDPSSPNGVIDALVVHAIESARDAGIEELSLNFAAVRRYLHEPVHGVLPHIGRALSRLATRWTQIDDLRYHNDKFSPTWERRFIVVDHLLHLPHIAFGTIWQEGQLPRPDAFIRPVWPDCSGLADAAPAHKPASSLS